MDYFQIIDLCLINLQPIRAINNIPIYLLELLQLKIKKAKSLSAKSFLNSEMIILGGVPDFCIHPPRIEAKERGIRNLGWIPIHFDRYLK